MLFYACLVVGLTDLSVAAGNDQQGSQSAEGIIKDQLCKILQLLEGPFGALITIVAGLAAVVAAAILTKTPLRPLRSLREMHTESVNLFKSTAYKNATKMVAQKLHHL